MHSTHNPSSITHNPAEKHAFSAKEKDAETGLSYFGSRYYSSDLSIWLSVDPMSGKYPSLSPYTYCANNPVKLVDPNGEEWENLFDAIKAGIMKIKALQEIKRNNNAISEFKKAINNLQEGEDASVYQKQIDDRKERNTFLQNGINGLDDMSNSTEYVFHFKDVNNGEDCYSEISTYNGDKRKSLITIYSDDHLGTRWHECVHVSDWLNETFPRDKHGFDSNGRLGHKNDDGEVETHAYRSEFAFSRNRFGPILKQANFVQDINGDWR